MRHFPFFIFVFVRSIAFAQLELDTYIQGAVNYLEQTQYKNDTINPLNFKGEWPVSMVLEDNFILLGKEKKRFDDSNCFTTSTIYTTLARCYLKDTTLTKCLKMLQLAHPKISDYQYGNSYNFWKLLPATFKINPYKSLADQKPVHRPTNFELEGKFMNKAANIANDADDTALAELSNYYHAQIFGADKVNTTMVLPFSNYVDLHRNNRHWYNHTKGQDNNTGAYLTWFADEYQFHRWNIFKDLFHNAFFYLPFSQAFPFMEKPYLPFGSNDIDAVVNLNIIRLHQLEKTTNKNDGAAIQFVYKKVKKEKYDYAAAYYPNRYNLGFVISQTVFNSDSLLNISYQLCVDYILKNQEDDGGWSSRKSINDKDRLQSTVFALGTLVNGGKSVYQKHERAITNGINYLLKNAEINVNSAHWKGGVIFSGGTIVRKSLFWISDAATTAMVLELLLNYRELAKR